MGLNCAPPQFPVGPFPPKSQREPPLFDGIYVSSIGVLVSCIIRGKMAGGNADGRKEEFFSFELIFSNVLDIGKLMDNKSTGVETS